VAGAGRGLPGQRAVCGCSHRLHFFKAGNHDGGWRATGAELLRRADEAAAGAPARAKALRLRAANAYAKGHAPADVLAAARLAGDAQLLAALEQKGSA
jgi:hypothetical protein